MNCRVVMNFAHAMGELCTLMLQRRLNAEIFAQWVRHHYGDPGPANCAELVRWVARHHQMPHALDRLRALEFDKYLARPGVEDSEFARALMELRNVFARNANMTTSATVILAPTCPSPRVMEFKAPPASSELAEVLARLLCGEKLSSG
jgi:hypothetical protein